MITWDEERLYETGLDRGVLYPFGRTPKPVDEVNYIFNPSTLDSTLYGWQTYGTDTLLYAIPDANGNWFNVAKDTSVGGQMGMRTLPQTNATPGMITRPAGAYITIQCEVRNPIGQTVTAVQFIARDDTNNDSAVLENITSGAMQWDLPADNVWRKIWVTAYVKAGRTFEGLYIAKAGVPAAGERLGIRNIMINDQEIVPYFNGSTPTDGNFTYVWQGVPNRSASSRRPNPGKGVPWNGLTSFEEGTDSESTLYYRDGRIYLADVDPSDFAGKMSAFFWPEEFAECLGIPQVIDGLYVDNQKPRRFNLSYRTLIGSGTEGDLFGYQIHLVYNCMASFGPRSRKTKSSSAEMVEFNFDIVATPIKMTGLRPTAHYVIDTRNLGDTTLQALETILYGTDTVGGRMPTPAELYDMLNFGSTIKVKMDANGWITITGASNLVSYTDANTAKVSGINAVTAGDGTITISAGNGTTT